MWKIYIVMGLSICICACMKMYEPHAPMPQRDTTVCLEPLFNADEPYQYIYFSGPMFEAKAECQQCNHALLNGVVEEIVSLGFKTKVVKDRTEATHPQCNYLLRFLPRISHAANDDFRCEFHISVMFLPVLVQDVSGGQKTIFESKEFNGDVIRIDGCVVDAMHSLYPEDLASDKSQNLFVSACRAGARHITEELFRNAIQLAK